MPAPLLTSAPVFDAPDEITPASFKLRPFVSIVNVAPSEIGIGRFIPAMLEVISCKVEVPVTDRVVPEFPRAASALMMRVPWFKIVPLL